MGKTDSGILPETECLVTPQSVKKFITKLIADNVTKKTIISICEENNIHDIEEAIHPRSTT